MNNQKRWRPDANTVVPGFVMMTDDIPDFDKLRLSPTGQVVVKRDLTIIPVRKPKKTEFFRKRPGEEYEGDFPIYVDDDGEISLIGPQNMSFFFDQGLISRVRLHVLIVHGSGVLLLSPIGLPDENGKVNSYNRSRSEAYHKAETAWVRIAANKSLGGYDLWTPESPIPEPEWPTAPGTLNEMLAIAFKGKYINDPNHPIINKLRGKL